MNGNLDGIRVLDIGQFLAGPFAATWLADLGADVIKVERPEGDDQRRWGKLKNGQSLYWKMLSRNKRSVTLNLKEPEGIRLLLELVKQADVVVENFRPGKLAEMGIGFEVLREANPKIVLLSVSAYGQTGPYSQRPGFGTLSEAMSGYAYITGEANGAPLLPAFGLADSIAGMAGAIAILAALRARDVTGLGQHIDVSLLEPLMSILGPMFVEYDQLGSVQERQGSRLPFSAPRNTYWTSDGKAVAMSSSGQRAFERSMKAFGLGDLIEDERFATNFARGTNVDELDATISAWFAERTRDEALAILLPLDVAAAPVYSVADIFEDEHVKARESLATVDDPDLGPVRFVNVPVKMSGHQPRIRHTGRDLRADNEVVYRELLGLDETALRDLAARNII